MKNRMPKVDSDNPLRLERFIGREDIYLLFLPSNGDIGLNTN